MAGLVGVVDANVLVPPGVRDLLLSLADDGLFRPVWQTEIEAEVERNVTLVQQRAGMTAAEAAHYARRTLAMMNRAFPDARLDSAEWMPRVEEMTNHPKDRHVLAAAIAADATHLVTLNLKDFPLTARPGGLVVQPPDEFVMSLIADDAAGVVGAVRRMSSRHRTPAHTPVQLAELMTQGRYLRRTGAALVSLLTSAGGG